MLSAARLPISGLLKQRRHRGKVGVCDFHHCDAALCVLTVGGGQDTPGPCETLGIGPYKDGWGVRCDDLPNCEREEGVLALFVCSGLVRVLAHVPNEEAQYMNATAHALRTIHGHDGPCLLPSVAMLGTSLHGVQVPPIWKSHGHFVIACEDGTVQPGGQIIDTLLDRLLRLRVDLPGPSLKVLSIARLPSLAVSAARVSI